MWIVGIKPTDADPDYVTSVWFKFEDISEAQDFIEQALEHSENTVIIFSKGTSPVKF